MERAASAPVAAPMGLMGSLPTPLPMPFASVASKSTPAPVLPSSSLGLPAVPPFGTGASATTAAATGVRSGFPDPRAPPSWASPLPSPPAAAAAAPAAAITITTPSTTTTSLLGSTPGAGATTRALPVFALVLSQLAGFTDALVASSATHVCKTAREQCVSCTLSDAVRESRAATAAGRAGDVRVRDAMVAAFTRRAFDVSKSPSVPEALVSMLRLVHDAAKPAPQPGKPAVLDASQDVACPCVAHHFFQTTVVEGVQCATCLPQLKAPGGYAQAYLSSRGVTDPSLTHALAQMAQHLDIVVSVDPRGSFSRTVSASVLERGWGFEDKRFSSVLYAVAGGNASAKARACPVCTFPDREVNRWAMGIPLVYSIGVTWGGASSMGVATMPMAALPLPMAAQAPSPSPERIKSVLEMVSEVVDLNVVERPIAPHVFTKWGGRMPPGVFARLRAVVCASASSDRFVAYIRVSSVATRTDVWVCVDERATSVAPNALGVSVVGPSWRSAAQACLDARLLPGVMLYEVMPLFETVFDPNHAQLSGVGLGALEMRGVVGGGGAAVAGAAVGAAAAAAAAVGGGRVGVGGASLNPLAGIGSGGVGLGVVKW